MLGYANGIRTNDGGTHIDGVKASITRTLNSFAKQSKVFKVITPVTSLKPLLADVNIFCWRYLQEEDVTFSGEHVREGLTCVVSVIVPNPEFEGRTQVCMIIVPLWSSLFVFCANIFISYHLEDEIRESIYQRNCWPVSPDVLNGVFWIASRCAWEHSLQIF